MRTTIDEIILKEKELAENFQRIVDTHLVSEDMSLEELYCDDTEVIEEELKRCQVLADFHNQIVDTMRKYQKIKLIVDKWNACIYDDEGISDTEVMELISDEVYEDGNVN